MLEHLLHTEDATQIQIGSVGWEGESEFAYLGSGDNDGYTLVRVQLFEGRDHTQPLNPSRAQGHKIICQISSGLYRVPKMDTRVYVAVPKGMDHVPGAPVIIAAVEKSPTTQFAKDRVVMDFGDDVHVVIKGKSVSIQDPEFRFVSVGTPRSGGDPGVQVHLPDGTGAAWQDNAYSCFCRAGCVMQMTNSKFEVYEGSGTFLKMGSGEYWTFGTVNKVQGNGVYLGRTPLILQTALYGPTGIAGVASTSVFLSV